MHRTTYHGRREQTAAEAPKNLFARIVKEVYPFGILFLIIFILLRFIFMLNFVPTASMTPTIPKKSLLISTRYDVGNIDRYDIVIFRSPAEEGTLLIKRVIGLPGETITVTDGMVYADGVELDSSFLAEEMDSSGDGVYVIPEDEYFMMGDNRNDSLDSRFIGYVSAEDIVAKAKLILFPVSRLGPL